MKIRTSVHLTALALLACLNNTPAAYAATTSTTFAVTATVTATCLVTALPLVFGNYAGNQLDGTSTITVTCTSLTHYDVGLNNGANASGTQRRMLSGGDYLNYELYTASGRTIRWDDIGGTTVVSGDGTGLPQTLTVYGRIPANQNPPTGVYTDTINVTLSY